MTEIEHYWLPNCGYLMHRVPDDLLRKIDQEVRDIERDFGAHDQQRHNSYLAGHLRHQYLLQQCVPDLAPYVEMLAREYQNRFNYYVHQHLIHKDSWVNFQSRHEFNPTHTHDGVISYVIWLQIPYDVEQELEIYSEANGGRRTSRFEFVYTNTLGNKLTHGFEVSREWQGQVCVFPAEMMHQVNPFYTTDQYRISVSGNLISCGPLQLQVL
jgi:hypothetical protein